MTANLALMARPKFKDVHAPYRVGKAIRIGGPVVGPGRQIEDPDGSWWALITAMDGENSPQDVIASVRARYPELTESDVASGMEQLTALGHVEDAAATIPAGLTEDDLHRHSRGHQYFNWLDVQPRSSSWDYLRLLRQARVTIIGMGASGGAAALALVAEGVGSLHCIDDDVVDLSNLGRQVVFTEDDVGLRRHGWLGGRKRPRPKFKVDAAAARLRQLDSNTRVTTRRQRVTGEDDVVPLAASCDVLLMCADDPADIRVWCNRACARTGTPWVNVGYHGPSVEASSHVPGHGACWECLVAPRAPLKPTALATYPEDLTARPVPHAPSAAAPAMIAAGLAAHHVLARITGIPAIQPGRHDVLSLVNVGHSRTDIARHQPGCQVCG